MAMSGWAWTPASKQHRSFPPGLFVHFLERAERRCVHGQDGAHAEDEHFRLSHDQREHVLEPVGGAEEERAVHLEHLDALRHGEALDGVRVLVRGVLLVLHHGRDVSHLRHVGHALHEQERGQHDARLDRDREIEQHREQEGHDQHRDVALRALEHLDEQMPFAHVVGRPRAGCPQASPSG